jgi:hypothetical protein
VGNLSVSEPVLVLVPGNLLPILRLFLTFKKFCRLNYTVVLVTLPVPNMETTPFKFIYYYLFSKTKLPINPFQTKLIIGDGFLKIDNNR